MEGLQLDYRIPFPCFFSPNWKQLPAVALLQTLLLGADSASRWEALTSQKRQLRAGRSSQPSLPAPGSSWSCTTPWKSTVISLLGAGEMPFVMLRAFVFCMSCVGVNLARLPEHHELVRREAVLGESRLGAPTASRVPCWWHFLPSLHLYPC